MQIRRRVRAPERRARARYAAARVNALPFADAAFSAIFSADVLCHRDVDERQALKQFHRCLSPDGILVLNLPAYRWMLSRHDAAVYNVRRYTRRGAARVICTRPASGLALRRLLEYRVISADGDHPQAAAAARYCQRRQSYPAPIEALCRAATAFERVLPKGGLPLPLRRLADRDRRQIHHPRECRCLTPAERRLRRPSRCRS